MTEDTAVIDTIRNVLDRIEKYLWIAIKHKNRVGINRILFSFIEIYRPFSLTLNTELYIRNKMKFNLSVTVMKLIINRYGRLGGILIDERAEDGFQQFIQFANDLPGETMFVYPSLEDDSEAISVWDELQKVNDTLTDAKFRTLFLVCAKAMDKKSYSFIYELVRSMESGHPRVHDISKEKLFGMLDGSKLERFWVNSISIRDSAAQDVFGLLKRPVNPISKSYLLLRSYSLFKGVEPDKLMTFPVPLGKDEKVELYHLLDSYRLNKSFLEEAYADLITERPVWEELFRGGFHEWLEKTHNLINDRVAGFEEKQHEIKFSLPLDEEKIQAFKDRLKSAFLEYRKKNDWVQYEFQEFPEDLELRKRWKRVGLRSLLPRDLFTYGLNAYGDILAGQVGGQLGEADIRGVITYLGGVAERVDTQDPLSQQLLLDAIRQGRFAGSDLVVLIEGVHRSNILNWPVFYGNIPNEKSGIDITVDERVFRVQFCYYHGVIGKETILVLPPDVVKVQTEKYPHIEINDRFKFSDYKDDVSGKAEFIADVVVASIALQEESKALVISFRDERPKTRVIQVKKRQNIG